LLILFSIFISSFGDDVIDFPTSSDLTKIKENNKNCPRGRDNLICSGAQGQCMQGECVCTEGFASHDCSYKRKSQMMALILSVVFPGTERLYLNLYFTGLLKFAITLVISTLGRDPETRRSCMTVLSLLGCCSFIWWIYDIVIISGNSLLDAHGYTLQPN